MGQTKGIDLAEAGCKYIGTPYSSLDCQAFVEKSLADIGIKKNLPGSNAWYREVMKAGWVGTPEECKKKFGNIPPRAFLFIVAHDGKEPAKYRGDGFGNASHIGIYTGKSGQEMCIAAGVSVKDYDFGNGAMHSSQSRGFVCPSNFNGKSISGGWNMVGLYNPIFKGCEKMVEYDAKVVGGKLNLRAGKSTSAERICQIPEDSVVSVSEEPGEWAKVSYGDKVGWCLAQYLEKIDQDADIVSVSRKALESVYDLIGDWLGLRG